MLHYILQTIAFQLFFLIIYDVFLKKETFFNWNRVYLIATALLSVVLPFIKVEQFKDVVPQQFIITLPEVVIGSLTRVESNVIFGTGVDQNTGFVFSWQLLFYLGAFIALGIFVFKLVKIAILIYKNPKRWQGDLIIVELVKSNAAFSFFYYVFLGEHIKAEDKDTILSHETIHVQQKHSIDLLVFEMFKILFWFNPLIYMYQNRITTLHEYIADAKALKTQDKQSYYENLLSQVFESKNVSFINSFFKQSLIKKRIIMIGKTKSKQILKLKYILLAPMVIGMLLYTSCTQERNKVDQNSALDLSQYSYTMHKEEGIAMPEEIKQVHDKFEAFLKANPNYVSWAEHTVTEARYSVHHKDEKVPENMEESAARFPDGSSYVMYINWPNKEEDQNSNSDVLKNINALKESIAAKGDMTEEEEKALKTLMMLVTKDGLNEPFFQDVVERAEIPFGVIENVPLYPGCENLPSNAERKTCMQDKITKHVQLKFNTDLAGDLGLMGRQRISVVFKIDASGEIVDIRARAPHKRLEEEAKRVVRSLPNMVAGNHEGKNVSVGYSLPIIFQVQ